MNGKALMGQVNMVLGWSADGRRWKWLVPNKSIIPQGKQGEFDACGVFGAKQDPLRTANDTLRIYYAGCNGPFFGSRGCALGLATLQRDGFAGYRGGNVITAPVLIEQNVLKVTVAGGNTTGIKIGIVGDSDFSLDNCDAITGKKTDIIVSWNGKTDLSHLRHGAFALEFQVPTDATAFAFSV